MLELRSVLSAGGTIVVETALHVGSGGAGRGASDNGIVLTATGEPFIPGSSLKGVFRSTVERLAALLNLTACHLEPGNGCAGGDPAEYDRAAKELEEAAGEEIEEIVAKHTCFVCRLLGSPLAASAVEFTDAEVLSWAGVTEVRDSVCLDRDARTAREGLKFDVEAVPAGAEFRFRLRASNLDDAQKALLFAGLLEWQRGFRVGGLASRGFGAARLSELVVRELNLADGGAPALCDYLFNRELPIVTEEAMRGVIEQQLAG